MMNVAMGILRAPEGVRAENWVTWGTANPSFASPEDDPMFVEAMVKGHRKWGIEQHGEVVGFPVLY